MQSSFDNSFFEWDDGDLSDSSDEMGVNQRVWEPGAVSNSMVLIQDWNCESNFKNGTAVNFLISLPLSTF